MINLDLIYNELTGYLTNEINVKPDLALILGSGLGDFADSLEKIKEFNTADLPGYPHSTVEGHRGKIILSRYENKTLLIFQGRIHLYEGYPIEQCILPVFIAKKAGCKKILITNAAGGINQFFVPGDLMLIQSFTAFNVKKELTGLIGLADNSDKDFMLNTPSKEMNSIIKQAALDEKIPLKEGIYWFGKGPSYETPAEIQMLQRFGIDAVGMSTVHELVYAAKLKMETAAISCITNLAAGLSPTKLSHAEVQETADMVKEKFEALLKGVIKRIH